MSINNILFLNIRKNLIHTKSRKEWEDAFNEIAGPEYEKEIKDNNIEVVSKPQIDIVQMEKGKDLIFTAIVSTKPEVILGKYERNSN